MIGGRGGKQRGLTLLEVVIALMLFAMISVFLLSGHSQASEATLRAELDRAMAELVSLRINLVALQPEEYEDGDSGDFPYAGASTRLIDEEEVFGDRYLGYTWELQMEELIGSGATGPVSVDDSDPKGLLFAEEGAVAETSAEDEVNVKADEVDEMIFIRVIVYPPEYDRSIPPDEQDVLVKPRSAWTAIRKPPEEEK